MTTVVSVWIALAISTIALAGYRKLLSKGEDTNIHLTEGGGALVQNQIAMAGKLGAIDKWGKILTVFTLLFGLALGCYYVYQALIAVPL